MKVSSGSKIRNLMAYAMKQLKNPAVKQITWNGFGAGTSKTITCAEIVKRKVKGLHQITNIRFKRIEEYWEPKLEGLERLKVNRDLPAITILLSKEPLDTTIAGYQPPGSFDAFWKKGTIAAAEAAKTKSGRRQPRGTAAAGGADSPLQGGLMRKKKKRGGPENKEATNAGQGNAENVEHKKKPKTAKTNKDTGEQNASSIEVKMSVDS